MEETGEGGAGGGRAVAARGTQEAKGVHIQLGDT